MATIQFLIADVPDCSARSSSSSASARVTKGFGEGNFRALFESIEEDQIRRGVPDRGAVAE
jgi:hypothetical protein